ncbi:UDP-2,3-diacylglucosamine diphosphatase [Kushneria indalinina]|uniref:UDP-2,3-diacylglucosamine hydrolase n=1 Tax=Kushneria indalinina DSM 14324 TaxID=1122140 RepID=A0A3D9DZ97_9GAMM|nr:UDP-2,3-diacylglucosamine diphosphatase [Kushneria indalinina]REC96130.1 UDP-2,3-diacylglucosamine hydrolase [Kushneria indalinina DSM 14324]
MTTLFIADLHLQQDTPELTRAFLNYLEYRARDADALYIMGDLFESWIGDDAIDDFEQEVIEALRRFSDGGRHLYVMHGNRDFLLGERFAELTGAILVDDPAIITIDKDVPALLMHGDSLCTQDGEYMQFRAMTRDPQWQQQTLAMPIEQRRQLADRMREGSGSANGSKSDDIMDVSQEAVEEIMEQCHVRTLIHGHTHRPDVHDFRLHGDEVAKRYVLGDWDHERDEGWEVRLDGITLTLEHFSLSELPYH